MPTPDPSPAASDLLAAGQSWLAAQLQAHAASPILYTRGADSVAIKATFGKTLLKLADEFGGRVEWTDRDFLVPVAGLVLGGVATLPRRGDLIQVQDAGGVHTFEVAPFGNEPIYRYSDPYTFRIHTKLISTEPVTP